jgi:hypothetical protein
MGLPLLVSGPRIPPRARTTTAHHDPNPGADMTSKSQARRNKRAQNKATPQEWPAVRDGVSIATQPTSRPTDERLARGHWAAPDSKGGAFVDLACDMIGRLFVSKQITRDQEESARRFQDLYSVYLSEIGIAAMGSCLNTSEGGHDAGDGNPEIYARYYKLRDRIGRVKISLLQTECGKSADDKPANLSALRNALDCLAA